MISFRFMVALNACFLLSVSSARAVEPSGYGQAGGEFDIRVPRVPADQISAAKSLKPPFAPTPEILAEGKAIFLGRGTCFQCHGTEGKGDGGAAKVLPIQPRNFTNPKFNQVRTPGRDDVGPKKRQHGTVRQGTRDGHAADRGAVPE